MLTARPGRRDSRGSRLRRVAGVLALLVLMSVVLVTDGSSRADVPTQSVHASRSALATDPAPFSISVSGNRLINGSGTPVVLHGVNRPGGEYQCVQGNGYTPADGTEDADAAAIAAWGVDVVRIPMNEDCWLGLNGEPNATMTAAAYRAAIATYVGALNARGIYAILDLHWTAPGAIPAQGQRSMPDGHTVAFWGSVAASFASNPAVLFDLFNEPEGEAGYPVSWACWRDGGCQVPTDVATPAGSPPGTYPAVGMQALVRAVRAAGATQPIMLGGLTYANDLTGWLAAEPVDTLLTPQLVASFHTYNFNACQTVACWDTTVAPVAAVVPVLDGEFGEGACGVTDGDDPHSFDNQWMAWADAHRVGYLGWGWFTPLPGCGSVPLVQDAAGTPDQPNGVALHDHLAYLATLPPTPPYPRPDVLLQLPVTPVDVQADLPLRFVSAVRAGRRLTLRLAGPPAFTGHVDVTTAVLVAGRHQTLHSTFVLMRGTTVALPAGARILTVVVTHAAGHGFRAAAVTELGSSVRG